MVSGEHCARAQARPIGKLGPALFLALMMCVSSLALAVVQLAPAAVPPVPAALPAAPGALQEEMPGPGIERLVARVQQRIQEVADLEARFVQRRLSRFGSVLVERQGKVFIRSPGRMRWEYDQPANLFVTAGEEAYFFQADDNQVQVFQPDSTGESQTPIMYLAGKGNLLRDFDIEETDWGPKLAPGNIQLHMRPRQEDVSFTFLVLEVEPMTATIARLVNVDRISNTIDYQFHDIEYDVGFPDSLFEFEIPQGADVVYIGG
jgi:outer membrane lipoprotein carrier protein